MLGEIAKATIVYTLHQQTVENVYWFKGGVTSTDVAQLIADILDCLRTALWPAVTNELQLVEVRAKTLYPTDRDETVVAALSTDKGSASGESLPSFCAAVISMRTGLGGKTHRGRNYIAGIPEGGQVGSLMDSTEWALVIAFATCLAGKFIGLTASSAWSIGVESKKLRTSAGGTYSTAFTPATNFTVTRVLGTQRRRKIGVGA